MASNPGNPTEGNGKRTERRPVEGRQHRIDNGPAIVVAEDQPPEQDFLSIFRSPVTVTHTPQPPLPKAVQGLHGTCPGARTAPHRGPQGAAQCKLLAARGGESLKHLFRKAPE